jgi:energy-coupling factor transporter ATP-binding protein EcfA2
MPDRRDHRAALRLTALDVRRFLGLRRPAQAVCFRPGELSPGVTLIAGPNGSGKTTTARAVEALLWPEAAGDPLADVGGRIEADGASWTVELAGPHRRWLQDGSPAPGPLYCPAADRDRYRLSLHELLTADDRNLAASIRRELGGGYSLADAGERLGFSSAPPVPRKGAQRLRQAAEAVAAASGEQAGLRRREEELVALRGQEREASQATAELQTVTCLLAWREAGRRLTAARQAAVAYDPRSALLRGREHEHLRDLQRRQAQAEAACNRATKRLAEAEAALAEQREAVPVPGVEALARCRTLWSQLQQAEGEARTRSAALAGATAREQAAQASLAERLTPEQLARLDRLHPDADLAEAVRAAAAAAVAAGILERFRGLPALTDQPADPALLERWRRGVDLLRAWLHEGPPPALPAATPRGPFYLACVAALLTAGLALSGPWLLLLPLAVVAVLAWWLRPRPLPPQPASRRPDLEASFAGLALPTPASWTDDAVARALDDLTLRWGWESARGRLQGEGVAVQGVLEKEAADRAGDLAACRQRLASRLGCQLDETPLAVFHLVTRIAAWQDARDALAEARRAAESARQDIAGLLADLAASLAGGGVGAPADSVSAAATIERLEAARNALEGKARERDGLAQELATEQRALADVGERQRDLFRAAGLRPEEEPRAEETLREWTRLRAACVAAIEARRAAEAAVDRCREDARRTGARRSDLRALRSAHLLERRQDLERAAARHEPLLREIESTETLVREAKRRHDLEQRLAERDEALRELERDRDAGWRAIAGQSCVELLASGLELQSSGVLRRAQELFVRITRGRYRLLADEAMGGAEFRARDSETGQVHGLATLSSGTRLQLLLAARLAFIAEKEGDGLMLPLVLDEVLGNSDDERAEVIVDAVIETARAGRQVFCLTAQADEVGKWQARLAKAGIPYQVLWLPRNTLPPPRVDIRPVAPPEVPLPEAGEPPLDYARRLGVPALDPFGTDLGSLHLWYLIDDPRVLAALLRAGYRTWGALSLLLGQEGGTAALAASLPAGLPVPEGKRLAARAEMVMLVLSLVRIGRGRPLHRAELLACEAVTDRYAEELGNLLERVGGSAPELLRCLEAGDAKGFRRRSLDELARWLAAQGHIDERPPLAADEVRARIHAGAGPYLAAAVLTLDDVQALLRLAASFTHSEPGPRPADAASSLPAGP